MTHLTVGAGQLYKRPNPRIANVRPSVFEDFNAASVTRT